jgi:hypothetical protein
VATVVTTARRFPGEVKRLHERIQRAIVIATHEVAHRGLAEAVQITNAERIVDTGAYKRAFRVDDAAQRRSTDGKRDMRFSKQPAMLINNAPHATYIEHGRRPGARPPPLEPIRRWVERKLGIPPEASLRVAFAIRAAIAKRGMPAKKVMFRTYQKMQTWWRPTAERVLRNTR